MPIFSNMSISARLVTAFGLLIVLRVVISAWGAVNASRLAGELQAAAKSELALLKGRGNSHVELTDKVANAGEQFAAAAGMFLTTFEPYVGRAAD